MKKFTSIFLIIALCLMMFSGCANSRYIDVPEINDGEETSQRVYVRPYGIFESDETVDGVEYSLSVGNVILAVLLVETIVVPIVIIGWYLFEPNGLKEKSKKSKK